jgi:hypothetical protein
MLYFFGFFNMNYSVMHGSMDIKSFYFIFFPCVLESIAKKEISSVNNNNRFRIQIMYDRLCHYTAFIILTEAEIFAFPQNLIISNFTECRTAITTNFELHTTYKPQILQFPCIITNHNNFNFWHVYVLALIFRVTLAKVAQLMWHWRHTGDIERCTRYVTTCLGAVWGRGRKTKIQTKAICCRACYYSILLDAYRVTSMADTDIDTVKKRKNAERIKQYRLKRKLLVQQQASKHIYMIGYFHP